MAEKDPEARRLYQLGWRQRNREKCNGYYAKYRNENKDKRAEYNKKHREENRHLYRAKDAKRHAAKLQRTVGWSDYEVMKMIYEDCPEGHHVDHIIPLQGEKVSGLHVAWNLQYLTAEENLSKGNKYEANY